MRNNQDITLPDTTVIESFEDALKELVEKQNSSNSDHERQIYSKQQIIVLRIALILHVANNVATNALFNPIRPEIVESASKMSEYFTQTSLKVFEKINPYYNTQGHEVINDRQVAKYLGAEKGYNPTQIAEILKTSRSQIYRYAK